MNDRNAIGGARDTLRVAIVADERRAARRLSLTLGQLAARGARGCELELIAGGSDPVAALAAGRCDLIHVCTAGALGRRALGHGRTLGLPVLVDYDPQAPRPHYTDASAVLSPSRTADAALELLGIDTVRVVRWRPGVDVQYFHPARYAPDSLPGPAPHPSAGPPFNVLHVGALHRDQGIELLAEAFLVARDRDPRLRLVLAGSGPEEPLLRARLGRQAAFLGELASEQLARVYASADLLVVANGADPFGDTVLEAHASGLPVLAVDVGAASELIENGRTGCLVPPDPPALAAALRGLARRATLLELLATGGLRATPERTWEGSLAQLAGAYVLAAGIAALPSATGEVARAA
jgi:glycosyltransferase involved in cell wall biosynthesis